MRKRTMLSVILLLVFMFNLAAPALAAEPFKDVPAEHWSYSSINQLRELGLSDGIGDNQFGFGQTITRAEFAAFLVKVMDWQIVEADGANFADNLDETAWYYKTLKTLAAHEVLPATGDFRPNESITGAEMAVMMVGALGFQALGEQLKNADCGFADVTENKGYIMIAKDLGLIGGLDAAHFAPNDPATREQAGVMMLRLYQLNQQSIETLHGFYAISSASQSQLIAQLDAASFGWSRLTLTDDGQVSLNTTRKNNNEFFVPDGFSVPVNAAKASGSAQLMVYADNVTATESGMLLEVILNDPAKRQAAVTAITTQAALTEKDGETVAFDGVVIDFEAMKGETLKNNFVLFLSELKTALGNKNLYVTVHPVRVNQAYYDGYDYRAIGDIADKVILMASDYAARSLTAAEMDMGYTMTPLSPLNEVYYGLKAITDANTGVRDHSKIWLQVSMDTAQWKLVDGKVINQTPYRPTYEAVAARLATGVDIRYPNYSYNPYAVYFDASDGTNNVLWYEDARSITAKAQLARLFGVGGLSIWRLGNIPDNGAYDLGVWQALTAIVQ